MGNSITITAGSVIIVLIVASMAGYAIGRQYQKRGFRIYESILTASMMIPFQTLMIPLYKMFRSMGLLNTLLGDMILIAGINMPFAIMMYIGFVRTLPIELEEAAMLEGCGRFKIFKTLFFRCSSQPLSQLQFWMPCGHGTILMLLCLFYRRMK